MWYIEIIITLWHWIKATTIISAIPKSINSDWKKRNAKRRKINVSRTINERPKKNGTNEMNGWVFIINDSIMRLYCFSYGHRFESIEVRLDKNSGYKWGKSTHKTYVLTYTNNNNNNKSIGSNNNNKKENRIKRFFFTFTLFIASFHWYWAIILLFNPNHRYNWWFGNVSTKQWKQNVMSSYLKVKEAQSKTKNCNINKRCNKQLIVL